MNSTISKEIQEWVKAGIISQETADNIEAYYRNKKTDKNRLPAVLGILGAFLIGLGIVLVIAHNWDEFNRPVKTFFAFLPLILFQSLCIYVLLKRKDSTAWKESSATLLFFAVGSCISLVSQIYHITGSMSSFLFTWMTLIVPLIYLMSSFVVALLYTAGITWYACLVGYSYPVETPYWYLLFLVILIPYYLNLIKHFRGGNLSHVLNWFIAISFAICFGTLALGREVFGKISLELMFVGYLSLFNLYYLIGSNNESPLAKKFGNPFFALGLLGILAILYIWSFDWLWLELSDGIPSGFFSNPFFYFAVAFILISILLLVRQFKRNGLPGLSPLALSVFLFILAILVFQAYPKPGIIIINFWLLLIGIYYVRKGSQQTNLGILNFGLGIVTLLALFRFFDDSIPFVWRGIIFLLTGAGIIGGNLLLLKKKKEITTIQKP